MKSLKESLFDKDLTSKKLSIEKCMDDFSSDALEKLDPQERNSVFDTIFESGTICNAAELRNNPVDLTKNIIIRSDSPDMLKNLDETHYPYRYSYIYSIPIGEEDEKTYVASLYCTGNNEKYYYWGNDEYPRIDKARNWKGKVAAFYTPSCSYSIISNEKWVKKIINSILAD